MYICILHISYTKLLNRPCINHQERSNNEAPVLTVTSSGKMKKKYETFQFVTVCSHHIIYAFWRESTLCICLNVKELLARNRRDI